MDHPSRPQRTPAIPAPTCPPLQRQLSMAFESPVLPDLSPAERARVVEHLANLLLQAAGTPVEGAGHDEP